MLHHLTPLRGWPVPTAPRGSPAAAADRDALLRHCAALAARPDRLRLSLANICARFVAASGPHWLGCFNQAQYAADHLGLSGATFRNLVAVGDLVQQVPEAAALVLGGQATYSSLVELARLGDADAVRAALPEVVGKPVAAVADWVYRQLRARAAAPAATQPARENPVDALHLDPSEEDALLRFSMSLPAPVALYVNATLEAAQLLLGQDTPPDQQLEAVVAEASTEVAVTVTAEDACRRFGVRWPLPASQPVWVGMRRSPNIAAARLAGSGQAGARAHRGPAAWKLDAGDRSRRAAFILHRAAIRQARRLARAQADLEDSVLHLVEADAPRVLGLPGIDAFAEQALGLAPRTVHDFLNRARRRRRDDLVAIALAQGLIGEVQADLLERLVRRGGVSRAAIGPWIDAAQRLTVRGLRDRVHWARTQADSDYRAWSLAGFPVPTEDQLRTSAQTLARCLADATPPDPAALMAARHTPQVRVELTARTAALVGLLQLMATLQDAAVRQYERDAGVPGSRPSAWWALLAVFARARDEWTQHAAANRHETHPILERDGYRCAASGCTSRRGLERHHIHYKGHMGPDDPDNLAALCATHHRLGEHGGILRVRGKAIPDARALTWELGLDQHGRAQLICRGDHVLSRAAQARG